MAGTPPPPATGPGLPPGLDPAIAADVEAVGRIGAVPSVLRLICEMTGMGFAAVARVDDTTWTACAVHDDIAFGLQPGTQLPPETTLCTEVRAARRPIAFDHASADPVYRDHRTPRTYDIESYISVPIVLPDGAYFGNLCAIDPRPMAVSGPRVRTLFTLFAELIALQLDNETRHAADRSALSSERTTAELREQFIAVLGHDLRNPLAAISATAEVLSRRADPPDVAAFGQRLRRSVRRMSRLIDDVLDLARGRLGGGIAVAKARVPDLADALEGVVAELRDVHPGSTLDARFDIAGAVHADRARLEQLLSNLVANAVTYGLAGEPVVVRGTLRDQVLTLSVSNRGPAIPPDHLARLFEPYWRGAPGGGVSQGLGLGLYICDQIARSHGGTLEVASTEADGTTFVARLPVVA